MSQTIIKSRVSRPSSTEAVQFTDGMLVTADDLQAAMHYPLSVVQVLLRSYFGCGIVCGFKVTDPNEGRPQETNAKEQSERGYFVSIAQGVALGCDGYPIELCREVKLDLAPDPCGRPVDDKKETRFIAIRRERAAEPSGRQDGCGCGCGCGSGSGCGSGDGARQQCTRQRDHILIQAFPAAPAGACMTPPTPYPHAGETGSANTSQSSQGLCDCMEECPDCDSCAAPWVIIAVLEVNGHGIVKDSINHPSLVAAQGGRKWVKPISCLGALDDRYRQAEDRLAAAEQQTANITASSTAAPQVKKETEGNKPKA